MKQCPNCKTNYTDDSLQFCLSDGANLLSLSNAEKTVQMSFSGNDPMRVNIPPDSAPTVFAPPPMVNYQPISQNQPAKRGFGLIIAGLFGVILLLVAGLFAAYLLLRPRDSQPIIAAASPTPTAAPKTSPDAFPTAAPTDETARLREEMANLKKQLETQKNQKSNSPVQPIQSAAPPSSSGGKTGYADSPGDGFLALRSTPDSETGLRIAKIPHGAALTVIACPKPSNVRQRSGRWCQVIYNGQSGWAFDGFISF